MTNTPATTSDLRDGTLQELEAALTKLAHAAIGVENNICVDDFRSGMGGQIIPETILLRRVPPQVEGIFKEVAVKSGIRVSPHSSITESGGTQTIPLYFNTEDEAKAGRNNGTGFQEKLDALTTTANEMATGSSIRATLAIQAFNDATKELPADEKIVAFQAFVDGAALPPATKQQLTRSTGSAPSQGRTL